MSPWLKRMLGSLLVVLLIITAFYIGTMVVATRAGTPVSWQQQTVAIATPPTSASESEQLLADIYARIAPSVVSINIVQRIGGLQPIDPQQDPDDIPDGGFAQSTGTGFVIDTNGHIVTNAHVVEGAELIEVNFIDGTIVRAEVVGSDLNSDIAVIRVDLPSEQLRPIALADSNSLFIGQTTIAIGSPFNQPWTMTTGIISALNRTIQGLTIFSIGEVIQTDAAINPGNSGGPLLNLAGEVIGVNAQISSSSRSNSGVGYAIPSNLVQRVSSSLIEKGTVDYSYIGISGTDMNVLQMEALSLPNNARGVIVNEVVPNGPAARAGLRSVGDITQIDGFDVPVEVDIITAIDGQPVTGMPSLISYLASNTVPGQTVTLTVVRNGTEQLEINVTLGARPE
ncbi:MAG: trypsin-like peptidase domain-containing protein [Chloroflexota bacterium]|nr:trypsin-like peptidase domain-containing protein [Chloroflexota bacterium]